MIELEFKNWMENTGNPFTHSVIKGLVYHGTSKKFDQFSYQKSQRYVLFSSFPVETQGFFFSENPHDALHYGNNVVACYVNLVNPLIDPRRDKLHGRLPYEKEMHILKILGPMIEKETGEPYIDIGVRRIWIRSRIYEYAHQWIYEAIDNEGINWDCLDNPEVIKRMISLGYDGTFVSENESHAGRSVFIPHSKQIQIAQWYKGQQTQWGNPEDYVKDYHTNDFIYDP